MAHDDPLRLRVAKAISAALGEIVAGDDYRSTLSVDSIFRGRATFGEGDPVPMVAILEQPLPPDQTPGAPTGGSETAGDWVLIIQGFVKDDKKNPTDPAHILMADVKKRLALEKKKEIDGEAFGIPEIERITISPGVVRPPDEVSAKAYFWLSLSVKLVEDLADPYG